MKTPMFQTAIPEAKQAQRRILEDGGRSHHPRALLGDEHARGRQRVAEVDAAAGRMRRRHESTPDVLRVDEPERPVEDGGLARDTEVEAGGLRPVMLAVTDRTDGGCHGFPLGRKALPSGDRGVPSLLVSSSRGRPSDAPCSVTSRPAPRAALPSRKKAFVLLGVAWARDLPRGQTMKEFPSALHTRKNRSRSASRARKAGNQVGKPTRAVWSTMRAVERP
jgi:hypothetical protein